MKMDSKMEVERNALVIAAEKFNQNDISGTVEELLKVSDLVPYSNEIICMLADCYYRLGEFERAYACWQKVVDIDENHRTAASRIKEYRSPSFQFWLKRYNEALELVQRRNYEEAQELLHALMAENDTAVSLYQLLGLCYMAGSDFDAAKRVWQRGLLRDKSNQILDNYLNLPHLKPNRPEPVRVKVKREERVNHRRKRPYIAALTGGLLLAVVIPAAIYWQGHPKPVIKPTLSPVVATIGPQGGDTQAPRPQPAASAKSNLKFSDNAAQSGNQGDVKYSEADERHYYRLGFQSYLRRDWDGAFSNFGAVVAMNSGSYFNREALYYLGRSYYLDGNDSQARKCFSRYINEFPQSNYYDDSLYYLGCASKRAGDKEMARQAFEKLQAYDSNSGYITSPVFQEITAGDSSGRE